MNICPEWQQKGLKITRVSGGPLENKHTHWGWKAPWVNSIWRSWWWKCCHLGHLEHGPCTCHREPHSPHTLGWEVWANSGLGRTSTLPSSWHPNIPQGLLGVGWPTVPVCLKLRANQNGFLWLLPFSAGTCKVPGKWVQVGPPIWFHIYGRNASHSMMIGDMLQSCGHQVTHVYNKWLLFVTSSWWMPGMTQSCLKFIFPGFTHGQTRLSSLPDRCISWCWAPMGVAQYSCLSDWDSLTQALPDPLQGPQIHSWGSPNSQVQSSWPP